MTQTQIKNSIESVSYKMSLKKTGPSNDSTTSDSDDASDSSSSSSSSSSSEASIDQEVPSTTKFSILKNDTDSGLRMKIGIPKTLPRKSNSPATEETNANRKPLNKEHTELKESGAGDEHKTMKNMLSKRQRRDSTTNSSCCSDCSDSDDDSDSSSMCSKNKLTPKSLPKHNGNSKLHKNGNSSIRKNVTAKRTINQKTANVETSDSNSDSSDESSDSELDERSPLPKPKSSFKTDFLKSTANQNLNTDGASSSDMEIPALVMAAIQRFESGSDGEDSKIEKSNNTQYTSSLLRDFVAKTQMLVSSNQNSNHIRDTENEQITNDKTVTNNVTQETTEVKRKRGRPRKNPPPATSTNESANVNSGSPDSGITSTSPVPSSKKSTTIGAKKIDMSTLEKSIYATERVLYPPRRKKHSNHQQQLDTASSKNRDSQGIEKIDPVWRKIDINKKFRRPSECGYRSDTNTICSKVLAAQSGYTSDYCNVNRRMLSGYKSDYSCKSRRSGYKSDYSIKAKSCGYRSDCSTRHRRKVRRKRRTKTASSTKPTVNEQDLLMLAGLSLGHSDDDDDDSSSFDSSDKPVPRAKPASMSKLSPKKSIKSNSISRDAGKKAALADDVSSNQSDRMPKHKHSNSNFDSMLLTMNDSMPTITSSIYKDDGSSLKLGRIKAGLIRRRRSSAVSHCSSHCSTISRHPFRRRRRRRLKSTTDQVSEANSAKITQQIDLLTTSFSSMCSIIIEKPVRSEKEKSSQPAKASGSRRTGKKRKTNQENTEVPTVSSATTSKRRNKKAVQTKSPDDHKLPLKKRHYLLTPGEKSENVNANEKDDEQTEPDNETETTGKAITPKKRHLLQTPVDLNDVIDSTDATSNSTCKDLQEIQASVSASITGDTVPIKGNSQSKKTENTRKKGRPEGSTSTKTNSNTQSNTDSSAKTPTTNKGSTQRSKALTTKSAPKSLSSKSSHTTAATTATPKSKQLPPNTQPVEHIAITKASHSRVNNARINKEPPPGVFEPSIDLELQIPFTEIPIPSMANKAANETNRNDGKVSKTNANKVAPVRVVEKLLHRTGASMKIGKRKRKKPNRTGFPTLKKKKKPATIAKPIETEADPEDVITPNVILDHSKLLTCEPKIILNCLEVAQLEKLTAKCDRVPSEGEPTGNFIERNSKSTISTTSSDQQKTKSKPLNKKSKVSTKTDTKQNETDDESKHGKRPKSKQNEIDDSVDESKHLKRPKTKEIDLKSKIKQKENTVEKGPAPRRGRPSLNKDDSLPAKVSKLSKSSTISGEILAKTVTAKSTERSTKPKVDKKEPESSKKEQEKILAENKKSTNEHSKLEKNEHQIKSVKRTINGRIDTNKKASSPTEMTKSDEEHKGRKRQRRDIVDENKGESQKNKHENHKRTATPTIHNDTSAVDKKRARSEKSEAVKSPSKDKIQPKSKPSIQETVTDVNDIVPFDEWIGPIVDDQKPLPEEENVNYVDACDEIVPMIDSKKSHAKLKKKYLVAGLFSNFYKTNMLPIEKSKNSNSIDKKTVEDQEPASDTLLPMPFFDKYLLQTQTDFTLPYDLWYAHKHDKLSGRNMVHSWNFKKLRTNVYADSVKPIQSPDLPQCSCKPEYECGDNCLNRLVYTECSPETCPCGDKCRNTKIQKHIVASVERFMTKNKGFGVKSNQVIKKGTYILEYVGEVVSEREFKDRMATLYVNDIHHYCLHLEGGLFIDGHRMGSDCRFVNHSCEPNCEMQKWSINGLSRMCLFAMRDIQPGEELTYDYNFALFNPVEGQVCKCESKNCRGVIGGKSQRVRPIENKDSDKAIDKKKGRLKRLKHGGASKSKGFMHAKAQRSHFQLPSAKEQTLAIEGHCFLLRNLKKIRNANLKNTPTQTNSNNLQISLTAKISALRVPRNIRTRGVTIAEHDPVVEKTVRIAGILREIYEELNSFKDASGQYAISKLNLPSKKKNPQYYEKIKSPIDLQTIEANVEKGVYDRPALFDADVNRLFENAIEYYGNDSTEATITMQLQTIYARKKTDLYNKLVAICGESAELSTLLETQSGPFLCPVEDPNEEHIRCICGLYRDEGVMIQCSQCKIWQHAECTGADTKADDYFCEKCALRDVDYEIPLKDKTEEGFTYYLSLMRGNDLQIRQSDTVYVLRDIPIEGSTDGDKTKATRKHTYETIGEIDHNECDIFRVERMWKDHDGRRFIYGHHYLRPHETYHEPTRKFYQNEVVRVPLYEVVPIELIMGRCWVMDLNTFLKGRPMDSIESHVYICELRVDKAARLFSKIKNPYPVCTKNYAFKKFRQRLKITRSYLPHEVNTTAMKQAPKKRRCPDEISIQPSKKPLMPIVQLMPPPQKTLNEKRTRLEKFLGHLRESQRTLNEDVQPLDLSYLLTGRGARRGRRTTATNVPHVN